MKRTLFPLRIFFVVAYFFAGNTYAQDTDGDTINNTTDLDDDNDGIIDTNEMGNCANAIYSGYSATVYDGVSGQDSWNLVSSATTFPVTGFTQFATFDYDEFNGTSEGLDIEFLEHPYNLSFSNDGDVSNHSGTVIPNNDNDAAIVFSRTIENTEAGIYDFQLDYADDHIFIYINGVKQYQLPDAWLSHSDDGVYTTVITGMTLNTGDILEIVVVEEHQTNTQLDVRLVKTANIGGGGPTCPIDTDGDGIADHLDVDADGDGCYDALEGADNILVSGVDGNGRLTGGVHVTRGIPNSVNTFNGQGSGTSTNPSAFDSFNQCDRDNDGVLDGSDVCPLGDDNLDSDSDGIPNGCDVDDDNDGILDTNELGSCSNPAFRPYEATVYDGVSGQDSWGLLSSSPIFPVSGFSEIATFDYNEINAHLSGLSIEFKTAPFNLSSTTNGDVSNYSGGTIPDNGDSDSAILFSRTIEDLDAGIYDFEIDYGDDHIFVYINGVKQYQLANVWTAYTDNDTYTSVLTGLTLNTGDVLDIVIVEEHTTNTQLDVRLVKTANISGTTTCIIDTDFDGVPDHLDLDADNDGCFDVVESGGFDANNDGILDGNGFNTNGQVTTGGTITDGYDGLAGDEVVATEIEYTPPVDQVIIVGNGASFRVGSVVLLSTQGYIGSSPNYINDVTATSTTIGFSYQWYLGDPSSGGTPINGTDTNYTGYTSTTLNIADVTGLNGTEYYLTVTHPDLVCIRTSSATLWVIPDPCDPVLSGNVDYDSDGVSDYCDVDDDNDGILDSMELRCDQPTVANPNSGSGIYQDQFYIFNWTDPSFSDGLHNGDSQTFNLPDGLTVTATISGISAADAANATTYTPVDMDNFSGAFLHNLYNTAGTSEALKGTNNSDITFTISFTGTKCGNPYRLDLLAFDAEATNPLNEYARFTTDGGNWALAEAYGGGGDWIGVGTKSIEAIDTETLGGNSIFYSENATSITTELNGSGIQAAAFGIWLICDTDADCIPDFHDLDTDGDGCPDVYEGAGSFTDAHYVMDIGLEGGSTDVFDNLGTGADADNDGLLDIVEPAGQAVGNSQNQSANDCPLVVDFDGQNDLVKAPNTFDISGWSELTLQFWVKAEDASQNNAGIIGQKGVLEITQNGNLECHLFGQGSEGVFSNGSWLSDTNTWKHFTLVYDNGEITLYFNGNNVYNATSSMGTTLASSSENFNIGGDIKTGSVSNHFNGWIDEVRVFNTALTESQVQQTIYQEIEDNSGTIRGAVIPKNILDTGTGTTLNWNTLQLYYKMGSSFIGRNTIDYSGYARHGSLQGIYTQQMETAPLPFVTQAAGNWTSDATWLHGSVWDLPLDNANAIPAAIIQIDHNVTLNYDIEHTGLIVHSEATLTIGSDGSDYGLENNWYLELDGTIDLQNDSQLIQTAHSDLVTSAVGNILRRQEGESNVYRYNYWAAPIGSTSISTLTDNNVPSGNPNNAPFSLNMIKDAALNNVSFTSAYDQNGSISSYWLYRFQNGITYNDWVPFDISTPISPGVGYTQKGGGSLSQYTFDGKPNNGTIVINAVDTGGSGSVPDVSRTSYLVGNPYPSAIDSHQFIDDNIGTITGTIYLWEQWAGNSHILNEYQGGYATLNKMDAVEAYQFVGRSGANNGSQDGSKTPQRYLPVGQGFIVDIDNDGDIVFNNAQRYFKTEGLGETIFFKSRNAKIHLSERSKSSTEDISFQKIRLEFKTDANLGRELVLGFSDKTSDQYDYGYDAIPNETFVNDLTMVLDGHPMVIQAFGQITPDKVIDLNFKSDGKAIYTIKALNLTDIPASQDIYLLDHLTGAYHDLKTGKAYGFTSQSGEFNDRFDVVFQNPRTMNSMLLSTEDATLTHPHIYYQSTDHVLYAKHLNSAVNDLSLINVIGQTVMEAKNVSAESLENGFKITNIPTGVYFVNLKTNTEKIFNRKIIVK